MNVKPEELKRVQAQIAISDIEMYPKGFDYISDVKRRIAEGIVKELLDNDMIDFSTEPAMGFNGAIYRGKIVIYKKEKSEE